VQKQCFSLSFWANLTSVDESKCLNHSKGRVAYTAYLRGEKDMIFEEEDEWEESEDEEWEEEEW
jgi:hypothetical protein